MEEIKFYTVEEFQKDLGRNDRSSREWRDTRNSKRRWKKAVMVPQSTIDENEALLEFIKMHTEDNNEAL